MSASSIEVDKSYLELPLMKQAFIHKSVSSAQNNERLEFLGDAVLEIVVSDYLFNRFDKRIDKSFTVKGLKISHEIIFSIKFNKARPSPSATFSNSIFASKSKLIFDPKTLSARSNNFLRSVLFNLSKTNT